MHHSIRGLRRREVIGSVVGGVTMLAAPALAEPIFRIVASGLIGPESPKPLADGSILVCEMGRGTLTRILPSGEKKIVADIGLSPNGCAIGPDGAAYVTKNAGLVWQPMNDTQWTSIGPPTPPGQASIVRVDLATGATRTIYVEAAGKPLLGCNDLVFDRRGGFWFSDLQGKCVLWARPDGSEIHRMAQTSWRPNGIALSPDGQRLFAAGANTIYVAHIVEPGRLANPSDPWRPFSRTSLLFDSMAATGDGGLVAGVLFAFPPPALTDATRGGLAKIDPNGRLVEVVRLPDPLVTSVAFGGPGLKTAYVTLTSTGRMAALTWPQAGLRLANQGIGRSRP